jgi:hypothetical protein
VRIQKEGVRAAMVAATGLGMATLLKAPSSAIRTTSHLVQHATAREGAALAAELVGFSRRNLIESKAAGFLPRRFCSIIRLSDERMVSLC